MIKKLINLKNDQSGQVIVMGAISAVFMVMCVMLVYNTGIVATERVDIQQTADAAAYTGALMQADALSTIAWINEGMAYIYYNIMSYAVNNIVEATNAKIQMDLGAVPYDAISAYQNSYTIAADWITEGRQWMWDLSAIEYGIAIATPEMVKQEIFDIAKQNGADCVAVYPEDFVLYPRGDYYFGLQATKIGSMGWEIRSLDPNIPWVIRVEADGTGGYTITYSTTDGELITSMVVKQIDADTWQIAYTSGASSATYTIETTQNGWVITSTTGDYLSVTQGPENSFIIDNGTTQTQYRRNPEEGYWEQFVDGAWEPATGPSEVTIDGTPVQVMDMGLLRVGDMTVSMPPGTVYVGPVTVSLGTPPLVTGQIGPAWFSTDADGNIIINGLSSAVEVGELKRLSDNDMATHKLQEISPDVWQYDYKVFGSYLNYDDPYRFTVIHAICDNDATFRSTGELPAWASAVNPATDVYNELGWFNPITGSSTSPYDYYQTFVCSVCDGQGCYQFLGFPPVPVPVGPCFAIDNDGDGLTDIRRYQADTFSLNDPPYQVTGSYPYPLVLTDDFFRFGVTVALWKEPTQDIVPEGQYSYKHPSWGYFGIACARPGVYDSETNYMMYQFEDTDSRDYWLANSYENLYEPTWEVSMFPVKEQIQDYTLLESGGVEVESDNGTSFLYRMIQEAQWRPDYDAAPDSRPSVMFSAISSPFTGSVYDVDSEEELENSLAH